MLTVFDTNIHYTYTCNTKQNEILVHKIQRLNETETEDGKTVFWTKANHAYKQLDRANAEINTTISGTEVKSKAQEKAIKKLQNWVTRITYWPDFES